MLFNSVEFFVFFPVVMGLFFACPYRYRWVVLLGASYAFYMSWRAEFVLLLVLSTGIDYVCGRMMGQYALHEKRKRKPWLWLSMFANLGILFTFKYFDFFASAAGSLAGGLGMAYAAPAFALVLPLGISFYTFQTMSYTIDVYHGRVQPEKHLGIFALFVSFFPQLVAGPIERAGNLLSQLRQKHAFDYGRVSNGLKLMAWGLFKKVVIADRLAAFVNHVYASPAQYEGLPLLLATFFFAFQVYCDFSGYTDIAIGAAQVMGIQLMENFRRPYSARTIREFWGRWHISLTTWFRDYLYIPLGGKRVLKWRWYYNVFIVFVISGLWHGANWTFLLWGALHGFYYLFGLATVSSRAALAHRLGLSRYPGLYAFGQVLSTFALVCFAWIFFRAATLTDAWYIVTHMFSNLGGSTSELLRVLGKGSLVLGGTRKEFLLAIFFILVLESVHALQARGPIRLQLAGYRPLLRWGLYSAFMGVLLYFGVFNKTAFIYFQF
jgi:alginate O-acetyltransferase complex protein AlgI